MAAAYALLLASLARDTIQPGQKKHHHISKAEAKQMLEREMHLHEELVNFLREIENAEEGWCFYGWLFLTAAVGLVLLAVIRWLVRRRRRLQAIPQRFRLLWPDLPEHIERIDITVTAHENNRARRRNLALLVPSS